MSRSSHGVIALLAVAAIVALVVSWPRDRPPLQVGAPGPTTSATDPSGTPGTFTTASPGTPRPPSHSGPTGPGRPATTLPGSTLTPCPRVGPARSLVAVTFNIHSGIGRDGLNLDQVAGEIQAIDPDVVLLQEVDDRRLRSKFQDEAGVLATLLQMHHVFASNVQRAGRRPGDPESDYGTAVLTRLPIESWTHTSLPNTPGHQPRGLQHLVLRFAGRDISVYNAHLDNTTPSVRQAQMRMARDIVSVDHLPVIFGGDFNASPGSATLRLALDPTHTTLRDPWPLVGDGTGLTVPGWAPRTRIDYLLFSPEWTPTAAATWQSLVSDHRGVAVRFRLPPRRTCR